MGERSPQDFSREFAGYMATAAEEYMAAIDASAMETARGREALGDLLTDCRRALASAIYEWRKRDARCAASLPARQGDGK